MQGLDGSNGRMPQWLPFVADFQKLPFVEDFHLSGAQLAGSGHESYNKLNDFQEHRTKAHAKKQHFALGKGKVDDDGGKKAQHEQGVQYRTHFLRGHLLLCRTVPSAPALPFALFHRFGDDVIYLVCLH